MSEGRLTIYEMVQQQFDDDRDQFSDRGTAPPRHTRAIPSTQKSGTKVVARSYQMLPLRPLRGMRTDMSSEVPLTKLGPQRIQS